MRWSLDPNLLVASVLIRNSVSDLTVKSLFEKRNSEGLLLFFRDEEDSMTGVKTRGVLTRLLTREPSDRLTAQELLHEIQDIVAVWYVNPDR